MNFFKIKKKQSPQAAVQTVCVGNNQNHPFNVIEKYMPFSKTEYRLYSTLREAVPIIDAAISKIVRLVGHFRVQCDGDEEIEYLINNFLTTVKVNACSNGGNSFILAYLDQLLTYGTAIGEIIINPEDYGIEALYNSSIENVELKIDKNPLELIIQKRHENGKLEKIQYPEFVLVSLLNPEPNSVYGKSIMKGLPFVSSILLKIFNSIGINWERIGNIRFAVTYKPSSDAGDKAFAKERAMQIASEWSKAMKNSTVANDFIAVGNVDIKVIGADNQILDSQIPIRQLLEQIVSKLSIPPFLLGLSWSTTETMSTQQADILTGELEAYRKILNPAINKICNTWLRINGFQADYKIIWERINLKDELQLANARFLNAKADEIEHRIANN